MLDALVAGAVEGPPLDAPPTSPALGACYIVAPGATDLWAGKSNCLAAWTGGGWRFLPAAEGMILYDRTSAVWTVFRDGAWELGQIRGEGLLIDGVQVVGAQTPAIAAPAGGGVIDNEGRAAIGAILGALRAHGLIDS